MEQKRNTAEKETLWRERIAELEASGLTHKDWCAQNRIAPTTLRYWRRRLKGDKTACANPKGFLRAVSVPDITVPASDVPVPYRGITVKAIVIEFPSHQRTATQAESGGTEAVREAFRALQSL
jgi:hypothetical protein